MVLWRWDVFFEWSVISRGHLCGVCSAPASALHLCSRNTVWLNKWAKMVRMMTWFCFRTDSFPLKKLRWVCIVHPWGSGASQVDGCTPGDGAGAELTPHRASFQFYLRLCPVHVPDLLILLFQSTLSFIHLHPLNEKLGSLANVTQHHWLLC